MTAEEIRQLIKDKIGFLEGEKLFPFKDRLFIQDDRYLVDEHYGLNERLHELRMLLLAIDGKRWPGDDGVPKQQKELGL